MALLANRLGVGEGLGGDTAGTLHPQGKIQKEGQNMVLSWSAFPYFSDILLRFFIEQKYSAL